MILQVEHNPEFIENGQIVAFLTGEKSINTYPKFLRIGEVIDAKDWAIKELSTGKIWKVYTQSVIKVDKGIPVRGVKATIRLTEHP